MPKSPDNAMTLHSLPPLALVEPSSGAGQHLARWTAVVVLHGALLYGVLHFSVRQEEETLLLPASISVRLLPVQAEKRPDVLPPPPKPTLPVRQAPPLRPQPVLAARTPDVPASFAVPAQPPAPPTAPAPVAAVSAPVPAPLLPVSAARFDADYLHNPKPVYPPFSRRNGEEGKVFLRVKVSAEGTALEVDVKQSSGFPRLDGAAREAVTKWRFIPARRGDEAIESWVTVPIAFALD